MKRLGRGGREKYQIHSKNAANIVCDNWQYKSDAACFVKTLYYVNFLYMVHAHCTDTHTLCFNKCKSVPQDNETWNLLACTFRPLPMCLIHFWKPHIMTVSATARSFLFVFNFIFMWTERYKHKQQHYPL